MDTSPPLNSRERLEREVERERAEHRKHDDKRAGMDADDELRLKDARESDNSGQLRRR